MKIMIQYDLINAIRNVNEPIGPFKIVRNRKNDYLSFLPIYTLLNLCNGDSLLEMIGTLGLQYGMVLSIDMVLFALYKNMMGDDFYTKKSSDDLKKLVGQLDALNISTSYDLLLKSEVYEKKYKVELNKQQLPHLKEEKYILVPSYTFNGDIKDTSVLQEHRVGSKEYILSLGSPKKVWKPAYSNM